MSDLQPYLNRSGLSGVEAYGLHKDEIVVRFRRGVHREYGFNRHSVGDARLETMKALALQGLGLHTFIRDHAHGRHAWKK